MLYNNKLWNSDIDDVIALLPELEMLAGKSVLVTGAGGLICSPIVDILLRYNELHNSAVHILAAGRSRHKMECRFGSRMNRDDFDFVLYDSTKPDNIINCKADYIIHGAANAHPDAVMKEPVETMMSNFVGMKCLLDYAKACGTERVLYISSSEVYGKKSGDRPYRADEYGYVDILNPRSSYSVGKRAAETLCASYASEYGVESVIVRPGHIYGPTALANDTRVSSAWAFSAARGENIIMKSDGSQIRSYCHCLDCASAIITVLLKGQSGHAYNISNPDSIISIRELGEFLSRSAGVELKLELPTEAEKRAFNPMSNSSLDSTELLSLGWRGMFNAERGLSRTVEILKSTINKE